MTFMSKEDLQRRSDEQLLELWQRMTGMFNDKIKGGDRHSCSEANLKRTEHSVAGLLSLSRETKRRGLEIVQTKFGKIILQPIKQTA